MRVCLLTPGQPSNNPRLVKEADALTAAAHRGHVICTDSGLWPSDTDHDLLAKRKWTCQYVGGSPRWHRLQHRWTRVRYGAVRRLVQAAPMTKGLLRTVLLDRK